MIWKIGDRVAICGGDMRGEYRGISVSSPAQGPTELLVEVWIDEVCGVPVTAYDLLVSSIAVEVE